MRFAPRRPFSLWTLVLVLVLGGWLAPAGQAQAPPPAEAEAEESGPQTSDSTVGYIDNAIPGNVFRLRFDAAYHNVRPTRGEFFYARSGPVGPGLPRPESSVDYQDLTAYLETAWCPRFSTFVEVPVRFLNPTINDNAAGLSDVTAGFKAAFVDQEDQVASVQLRIFAPSGDAHRGLGTRHVSLEPSLLYYRRLTECLSTEGELRYWVPVGGTRGFAGDLVRYGVGLQYRVWETPTFRVSPVIEAVGWTFLNGQQNVLFPSGLTGIEDAAGDSIFNLKLGVRVKVGELGDIYTGYGRALTGDTLYRDIYRLEFRLFY